MEKRSKFALKADKSLKAMGAGERTSKKVSTIRKADGSSFKRRNANQFVDAGQAGGNEYTEKRVNRTDKFNTGGTADSSENGGANIGGTLASSMMKNGGVSDSDFERDYKKVKNHIKEGYGYIDSGYVETTWENLSNITYSAIEDKLIKRLKKDSLYKYAKGGKLIGKQKNLDLNKNGKLDSEDFKMIQGKKANGGLANVPESFPETDAMSYKKGGAVDSHYEKMIKDNWENISYAWETGGKKVPNSISNTDAEDFLNDFDSNFDNMNEQEQAKAITKFKNAFKSVRVTKMEMGGSTKGFEYSIGGL